MSELLVVRGLKKSFHDGERELRVLRGVDLNVAAGQAIAVVGMSGAGKSTLLHLIGGLDVPDSGSIRFRDQVISDWPRARMNEFRNRSVGFVFQFHHLMPEFSALENVMMPALVARLSKPQATERARTLLGEVGLSERANHRPAKLSGGEQQRVALARAMINRPALLLADEPSGNLDPRTGERVIDLLWKKAVTPERALVIVTHEPSIAERADRIFQLNAGKLDEVGHAELSERMIEG